MSKVSHSFNFDGGKFLTNIGASWFVSYSYYKYIDKTHNNWNYVATASNRISTFNNTLKYHKFWLEQILYMNDINLNKNTISLSADQIKQMIKEILNLI